MTAKSTTKITKISTPQKLSATRYIVTITSCDENHLCRASLHKSHKLKISLKAHGHACAHGVGTPIARPEKLPRQ